MISMPQALAAPVVQPAPAAGPSAPAAASEAPQASAADLANHEGAVRSPMVGTVYRALNLGPRISSVRAYSEKGADPVYC